MRFGSVAVLVAALGVAALPLACGTAPAIGGGTDTGAGGNLDGGSDGDDAGDPFNTPGLDASSGQQGDGGFNADGACAASTAQAQLTSRPVDIIVLVDNSCSMKEEVTFTNDNLNQFAQTMSASNIDYRVVMISKKGTNIGSYPFEICIKPPLAGDANCGDGPRFHHVNYEVASTNPLKLITSTYDSLNPAIAWKSFLRPNSQKEFLIITDDNSSITASTFETNLFKLLPAGTFTGYVFHSICGYFNRTECPSMTTAGTVYLDLTTRTGGEKARICDSDWKAIFTKLAQAVVAGSKLSCDFAVPAPPPGKTLSTSKVSVIYTPGNGGAAITIEKVANSAACTATPGFYFDDNTRPTKILICPTTCAGVQGDAKGKIDVLFACSSGGPN